MDKSYSWSCSRNVRFSPFSNFHRWRIIDQW